MTSSYLTEIVNYGGLPTTRGDMILDLQRTLGARGADSYLMGHSQSERMHGNPFESFATVEEATAAILAQFAA